MNWSFLIIGTDIRHYSTLSKIIPHTLHLTYLFFCSLISIYMRKRTLHCSWVCVCACVLQVIKKQWHYQLHRSVEWICVSGPFDQKLSNGALQILSFSVSPPLPLCPEFSASPPLTLKRFSPALIPPFQRFPTLSWLYWKSGKKIQSAHGQRKPAESCYNDDSVHVSCSFLFPFAMSLILFFPYIFPSLFSLRERN